MKIAKVETFQIKTPRYYQEHPVQTGEWTGHVVVKLHVDEGLVGLGEAPDSLADDLGAIARRYNELLVGRDATRITEINEFLRTQDFASTVSNPHLTAAIDLALYDLNGKLQGVPAYRLLGGKMRENVYFCYPIIGEHLQGGFERNASYLQRLVDLGHHLFRYYISGDSDLDDRFLSEMKARFGEKIRLKAIDLIGSFPDWETALRYTDVLRRHDPMNFEQPSNDLRVCADFVKRVDVPVSQHIGSLEEGLEAIERGARAPSSTWRGSGGGRPTSAACSRWRKPPVSRPSFPLTRIPRSGRPGPFTSGFRCPTSTFPTIRPGPCCTRLRRPKSGSAPRTATCIRPRVPGWGSSWTRTG